MSVNITLTMRFTFVLRHRIGYGEGRPLNLTAENSTVSPSGHEGEVTMDVAHRAPVAVLDQGCW